MLTYADMLLQARNDLIGYLVNTTLLSRVEKLVLWGAQTVSSVVKELEKKEGGAHHRHDDDEVGEEDACEAGGDVFGLDCHTLRSEQRLLAYSLFLLQAITCRHPLGTRRWPTASFSACVPVSLNRH
jgi:hypothetical protein